MQKCETEFRYQVSFQIIRSFLLQFHGKVSLQIRIYCVNDFSDGNFFLPNRHYSRNFKIVSKNCKAFLSATIAKLALLSIVFVSNWKLFITSQIRIYCVNDFFSQPPPLLLEFQNFGQKLQSLLFFQ